MAKALTGVLPATLKATTVGRGSKQPEGDGLRAHMAPELVGLVVGQCGQASGLHETGARPGQDHGDPSGPRRRRSGWCHQLDPFGRGRVEGGLFGRGERGLQGVHLVVQMVDPDPEQDSHDGGGGRGDAGRPGGPRAPAPFGGERDHIGPWRRLSLPTPAGADRGTAAHQIGPIGTGLEPGRQALPRRRRRSVQLTGDAVPQGGRRGPTRVGQEPGHLMVLGNLGGALGAPFEMALDHGRGFRIYRVEGEHSEQLLDLAMAGLRVGRAHNSAPAGCTPRSARLTRRRPRPVLIRLLMVPSGSLSISATTR